MIAWYSRDKSSFKSLIRSLRVTAALPSPFFVMSFSYEQLLNVLNRQSFGYTGGAVSDGRVALRSLSTRIFTASGPALRASKSYHEKCKEVLCTSSSEPQAIPAASSPTNFLRMGKR